MDTGTIAALAIGGFLIASVLVGVAKVRRQKAELRTQLELAAKNGESQKTGIQADPSEVVLGSHARLPINVETLSNWSRLESFDVLGRRFPDGSVTVTRLRSAATDGSGKFAYLRLTKESRLTL
jgi:hypothetical protein